MGESTVAEEAGAGLRESRLEGREVGKELSRSRPRDSANPAIWEALVVDAVELGVCVPEWELFLDLEALREWSDGPSRGDGMDRR